MPTEHNSTIYKGSFPQVDAASIMMLRHAGALIFGKGHLLLAALYCLGWRWR